jgi:hypothetical protein
MKSLYLLFSGAILTVILGGCQTVPYQGQAHDVKRKPSEEGVVGIPVNYRDEDRAKAETKMKSNCGEMAYKITEEGEVVIGQETTSSGHETDRASTQRQVGKLWGMPITSGEAGGHDTNRTERTSQVKEWQIAYKCMANSGSTSGKKVR